MKQIMSIENYHAEESISKSKLDLIDKSLRHFTHPVQRETDYFNFGHAVHDCILSPDVFAKKYVRVNDSFDARKKEYKEMKEIYDASNITIIKEDKYSAILDIKERIMSQEITRNIIEKSEPEISFFTEIKVDGSMVKVKCRPDALEGRNMIDLKTTQDSGKNAFMWSIKRYRYHVQAAFYSDVYELESGNKIDNFLFIAIDSAAPYAIRTYILNTESVDLGRRDYKKNLLQIKKYRDNPEKETIEFNKIESIGLPSSSFFEDTI